MQQKFKNTLNAQNTESNASIIIKSGYEHIQINTSDIVFIKSDSDYTEINTIEKVHLSKESLKQWLEKLDLRYFCQVHKSYLINI